MKELTLWGIVGYLVMVVLVVAVAYGVFNSVEDMKKTQPLEFRTEICIGE